VANRSPCQKVGFELTHDLLCLFKWRFCVENPSGYAEDNKSPDRKRDMTLCYELIGHLKIQARLCQHKGVAKPTSSSVLQLLPWQLIA
jgi:hypothetical protein